MAPSKLFCWRCHGYQEAVTAGSTLNISFPERCLDVAACRRQWDEAADKARERAAGMFPVDPLTFADR
jgi:hypothetical protein